MKHDLTRYELLDFGRGRKLERIGGVVLDRPCPAADFKDREQPSLWREADVSYDLKPRVGWCRYAFATNTFRPHWDFSGAGSKLALDAIVDG
jgi:hypothetical protein